MNVGEEVMLADGMRGKITALVMRNGRSGKSEYAMVQFPDFSSRSYPINELQLVEVAAAAEPVKTRTKAK